MCITYSIQHTPSHCQLLLKLKRDVSPHTGGGILLCVFHPVNTVKRARPLRASSTVLTVLRWSAHARQTRQKTRRNSKLEEENHRKQLSARCWFCQRPASQTTASQTALQLSMEVGEENGANGAVKRQRAPLSDSEDNVLAPPEGKDGQKRRRLEAAGQENHSPKAASSSSSGRLAELDTKPDTPMVPSVRSRVQQLTQRREGGASLAQRCFSDPGTNSPSLIIHEKGFLGQGEFNQRLERFKVPVFHADPTPAPSPAGASPRTRSDFVSSIQQKLHGTPAPSTKQASRIRQEREEELSHLPFQPISENAWLKRSSSDPSLSQIDGDAEMKDGSFTDASCAEKQPSDGTSQRSPSDSEAPVELDSSHEVGQLNTGWKEQHPRDGVREEEGDEEQTQRPPQTQRPQTQTVLELSFSEDQSSSKASESPPGDEQSSLESTLEEESDLTETIEVSVVTEEAFSYEERDGSSYSEGAVEPSTDEELRLWRYPQDEEESMVAGELEEGEVDSSRGGHGTRGRVDHSDPSDLQDDECYLGDVSAETTSSSDMQEEEKPGPGDDSVKHRSNPRGDTESCGGLHEGAEAEDTGGRSQRDDVLQPPHEIQTVGTEEDNVDLESDTELQRKRPAESSDADGEGGAPSSTEGPVSDRLVEAEQMERVEGRQAGGEGLRTGTRKAGGGEGSKKVTFSLEPELINDSTPSEADTSTESRAETSASDAELSSHDETNTAEIIDQMFEEVLEYAERMEEEERGNDDDTEDHDSGIGVCPGGKGKTGAEKERGEEEEEGDASETLESDRDELIFPPSGILSPLSKSVEAVVTPLRLAASQEPNPSRLLSTPEETTTTTPPPAEAAPLYSIDAYRTQRQSNLRSIQSVTPGVQRRAPERSQPPTSVSTKEKITALGEEAGKLQTVINQTLQALSCCTDEEHGRGSLEEAEAEKLLLVSCEKRSALLAEVSRLREERRSESEEDSEFVSQQACRGTVSITKIQLPLKVEFVCSSHKRSGRPSHYFFVLIRYGPCNIVATPLATAADAQNGDTISFPTSVTLKDIRPSFEIDVEVYSLSHTSGSTCSVDRTSTKSRVTPRKLLNTITRSGNSLTSGAPPALNTRRSSNFFLVGSHKITLASLGHGKFPLDKMKLEGKIRRLLGDEFQEKVPFLSPLEGNIYLHLDSEGHSSVQHRGFLTMFELISGFGVWHRRYFVLVGCTMSYWNHPNDQETKEAEGSISLSGSLSRCVRPVKRDSCARPFTFELVSSVPQQQDASAKCWFSADTKQERLDWMEKLNQALLDFNTWNQTETGPGGSSSGSSSGGGTLREMRESVL